MHVNSNDVFWNGFSQFLEDITHSSWMPRLCKYLLSMEKSLCDSSTFENIGIDNLLHNLHITIHTLPMTFLCSFVSVETNS